MQPVDHFEFLLNNKATHDIRADAFNEHFVEIGGLLA